MFVQTLNTPNPNSLKFLPGEKVSLSGPVEFTEQTDTKNELIRNIMSINGVSGIFLSEDFLSVNKHTDKNWEDIKHIIISFINDFYADGNKFVYDQKSKSDDEDQKESYNRHINKLGNKKEVISGFTNMQRRILI